MRGRGRHVISGYARKQINIKKHLDLRQCYLRFGTSHTKKAAPTPYFVEVQAYTRAVFNAQPGSLRGCLLFGDVPLQVHCWFLHHYTKRE